jgi:hypothetical protein
LSETWGIGLGLLQCKKFEMRLITPPRVPRHRHLRKSERRAMHKAQAVYGEFN